MYPKKNAEGRWAAARGTAQKCLIIIDQLSLALSRVFDISSGFAKSAIWPKTSKQQFKTRDIFKRKKTANQKKVSQKCEAKILKFNRKLKFGKYQKKDKTKIRSSMLLFKYSGVKIRAVPADSSTVSVNTVFGEIGRPSFVKNWFNNAKFSFFVDPEKFKKVENREKKITRFWSSKIWKRNSHVTS